MALPPKLPIGGTQDYFNFLKDKVAEDFGKQNINGKQFELNFEGLNELLDLYNKIDFDNLELCVRFSRSFNLWAMYICSIRSITKKFWLDSSTLRIAKTAIASKKADEKSVANGDRCANKDENVIKARYTENSFESFYNALKQLEDFIIRCHYEVKLFCELNHNNNDTPIIRTSTVNVPLPPANPFSWGTSTYLEYFVATINSDFKAYGVQLNFTGLINLSKEYLEIDYKNLNNCSRMSRDFNMWSSYIDSLESTTKKLYLDAETNKTNEISVASFLHGGKNKSHGERLANMDEKVIKARQTRNSFDAFHECLESLEQFFIRCHYETRFFGEIHNPKATTGKAV